MKYDLSLFPVGPNGKRCVDEFSTELDYKDMLVNLCGGGLGENGQPVMGRAKMKFYDIFLKVKDGGIVELTSEDVGLLNSAAVNMPIIIAGQVIDFLNHPKSE